MYIASLLTGVPFSVLKQPSPSVLVAETCVFAYLGMAIFSFKHQFKPAFVIWTIVSVATNIVLYRQAFPKTATKTSNKLKLMQTPV